MMARNYSLAALALCLAFLQSTWALTVSVTQISCTRLYFTLGLTTAEIRGAANLGLYIGGEIVSEIGLSGSYSATVTSADFYAIFFDPTNITSGATPVTFQLLDANDNILTTFAPVTQTITFQCGTTITTTTNGVAAATTTAAGAAGSTSTSGNSGASSSGSNTNSSGSNSSTTSSKSSSSTGAIAGGVVGGVAVLAIAGIVAFCLMRRKKKQRNQNLYRRDEADEAAFRGPNNDSTASLATAPERADTPMMREVSPKNVFADPTSSSSSAAPSGSSSYPGAAGAAGAAAAAGAGAGIGAAAIAARKQSREHSRARSPSQHSDRRPSSEFSKGAHSPDSQVPPPVPALPSTVAGPKFASTSPSSASPSAPDHGQSQSISHPDATMRNEAPKSDKAPSEAAIASVGAGAGAGAAAAAAASGRNKGSKWGFKRSSQDQTNAPLPANSQRTTTADVAPLASTSAPQKPAEVPESPSRSFKVIPKPAPAPMSTAGPSSASVAASESSANRVPAMGSRSNFATPAGSIRGNNYSRAPSVASMSAGFGDAPPMPSTASVASAPAGEFGNMAGIGAGRSFATSSGNSTKWHQQSYNIMPNFTNRALARSTRLDEDLIFGHLGMGLAPPPGPAGNGSESGSSKSRQDPFGDR